MKFFTVDSEAMTPEGVICTVGEVHLMRWPKSGTVEPISPVVALYLTDSLQGPGYPGDGQWSTDDEPQFQLLQTANSTFFDYQ